MQTILDAIYGFMSFILLSPWHLIVSMFEWIQTFVLEYLPNAIWALMPDGVVEFLASLDVVGVDSIVASVTWFFPFWVIVKIYVAAYAMSGGIRIVRYIVGFVPTIEG